jgi:asparagine synthase (glutamine-hydrolysing)
MCGIAGAMVFRNGSFAVSRAYIDELRDSMTHRGPDGSGTWISDDRKVGLGHRRLSIVDLSSAAAQPMSNQDESVWVTFNGEIYNHAEIRRELEETGSDRWKTDHSDTEVILHAYERWGLECIHRFRGMFAFALYDTRRRKLWLVRDRLGIKPLYYSIHHGRLVFASEIKALLTDSDQVREVNEEALYHFLSFLVPPAPSTLFAGIQKLEAGTWLLADDAGDIQTHRYWDVWDHTQPLTNASDEEIAERLLAELRQAVQLRKMGDVPVGVFLSGGIDSSTNAALFSEHESQPVKTFSIGYDGQYRSCQNELHYARRMALAIGSDHHERIVSQQDLLEFLPQMVQLQDEPIADPVCVPVYYVSKLARENDVIVCQLGEGSDELFWGYRFWKIKWQLQKMNHWPVPAWSKRVGLAGLSAFGQKHSWHYEMLRRGEAGLPVFWSGAESFTESQKKTLLSERLRKQFAHSSSWDAVAPLYRRFQEKAWEKSTLNWMTYSDLNLRLPELLLMRVDKMSMGVSLEARVPFLDHKFVELAMSIPEKVKTRNGTLKHILKKAVRGVIPDDLIDRKKQGFGVPIQEWFVNRLGTLTRNELRAFCRNADFLDSAAVEAVIQSGAASQIWVLLNLALWWKHYIAQESTGLLQQPHARVANS